MALSYQEHLERVSAGVPAISVRELRRGLDAGEALVLVDVREPEEWDTGVVPGSLEITRGQLEARIAEHLPAAGARIAVICSVGERSASATRALLDMGFPDVANVAGGVVAWTHAGFALERRPRLTGAQRSRYSRQVVLPMLGEAGQRRLLDARVLCVGAGGLGSPVILYLAAAGVGTIGVVDDDAVDLTNLQRQILHSEATLGVPKVDSARAAVGRLNGDVTLRPHRTRLTADNALELFADYDVVVDGTDNFPTRYLINDACVLLGLPNVHGSIFHLDGQVSVFHHDGGPCYRCLYPEPPPAGFAPSCAQAGVLGALCGVVGALQAVETIKLVAGMGTPLAGRLLSVDAGQMRFRELRVRRDPGCPACGDAPTIEALGETQELGCARG